MKVLTKEEFLALPPAERGYVVYMYGAREDQPHVPDETNPFPAGSAEAVAWNDGQHRAMMAVVDLEE